MFIKRLVTLLCMLTLSYKVGYASQQVVEIEADKLLMDNQKGIAHYKGNVSFKRDNLLISADEVIVFLDNGKITRAEISGQPADIKHHPEKEDPVHARAQQLEYDSNSKKLILKGNAIVTQGEQQFSGEKIEYDSRSKSLAASGGDKTLVKDPALATGKKRVHVIIGPTEEPIDNNKTGND